jgi:hypothetical protein
MEWLNLEGIGDKKAIDHLIGLALKVDESLGILGQVAGAGVQVQRRHDPWQPCYVTLIRKLGSLLCKNVLQNIFNIEPGYS